MDLIEDIEFIDNFNNSQKLIIGLGKPFYPVREKENGSLEIKYLPGKTTKIRWNFLNKEIVVASNGGKSIFGYPSVNKKYIIILD